MSEERGILGGNEPSGRRMAWWWCVLIACIALLAQSPFLWGWIALGFPTYGKWLYGSIWCVLLVTLDGLAALAWCVSTRRTGGRLLAILVGLVFVGVAALPLAVILAGIIHKTLGEV